MMALIGVAAAYLLLSGKKSAYSYGGNSTVKLNRDPSRLIPAFAQKLEILFQRMRARGFDPIFNEGYRDPARALQLAKEGVGITESMHSYGAAADIVDRKLLWGAPAAFWTALGEEAEALGLTWGGRFTKIDKPHVQAVTYAQQTPFKSMSASAREQFVGGLSGFEEWRRAA